MRGWRIIVYACVTVNVALLAAVIFLFGSKGTLSARYAELQKAAMVDQVEASTVLEDISNSERKLAYSHAASQSPSSENRVGHAPFNASDPVLLKDTRYLESFKIVVRGSMARQFSPLLNKLQLSDEKRRRVLDLLIEEKMTTIDVAGLMTSKAGPGGTFDRAAFEAALRQALKEVDDALVNEIGPESFQLLADYKQSLPIRESSIIKILKIEASASGRPLPDEQVDLIAKKLSSKREDVARYSQSGAAIPVEILTELGREMPSHQYELLLEINKLRQTAEALKK